MLRLGLIAANSTTSTITIKNTKPSQETKENVTLEEWMVAKTTRRRGPSQNYNSQNTSSNTKTYNKNTNSFTILNNETVEEPQTTYEGSSKDKITTEQAQSTTENQKEKQSIEDDKKEQLSTEDDLSSDNGDLHGEEIDDLHFKEMDNITKEDSKEINNTMSHKENTNETRDTQLTTNSDTQILQDSQVTITINKTQIDDDSEMNDGQPSSVLK
ncbi:hypothetical protein B5S33_g5833 [[Candida] boidinii]|nr:hypothetical protein B5S33_g5833 [[Candida] boidinii]